MTELSNNGMRQ